MNEKMKSKIATAIFRYFAIGVAIGNIFIGILDFVGGKISYGSIHVISGITFLLFILKK